MMRGLRAWLSALVRRHEFERDLDDELAFHLEQRSQQLCAQGVDAAEANRRARIELGMLELHRDSVRRAWGLSLVDDVSRSVRLALRSLLRTRGFTLTAVTVLALPLALGVLLYGLFATYAFQMPAFERVDRWFYLEGRTAEVKPVSSFTEAEAAQLLSDPPAMVEGLFSHQPINEPLSTDQHYRGLGESVSDNFFRLTGLPPALGRLWFGPDDPRDRDTLILSARGHDKLFGRDAEVIGQQVRIGERSFTVIGVIGRDYGGLMEVGVLYWIRAQDRPPTVAGSDDSLAVELGGFLREGASVEALTAALEGRAAALSLDRDAEVQLVGIDAVKRSGVMREADRRDVIIAGIPLAVLMLLILLIAAANLANLVLARFSARRHDLALRAALGASRGRLFFEMLLECLLLGAMAGLAALLLVALLLQPIHQAVFGLISEMGLDLIELHIGWGTVLVAFGMALFAAACFGTLPAWWLTAPFTGKGSANPDAGALKKSEPKGLRGGLMTLQLAASVFLVVLAGLVAANARVTRDAEIGFDPGPMVALSGIVDGGRLARELELLPNVAGVSATSTIPFMAPMHVANAQRDGQDDRVRLRFVDAGWWGLLGLELQAGRRFNRAEGETSPSAIVSERAATLLWPNESPLGKTLRLQGDEEDGWVIDRQVEVVGVVKDYASGWLLGDPLRAVVYLPAPAGSAAAPTLMIALRDASAAQLVELQRDCLHIAPQASCQPVRIADALRMQRLPLTIASRLSASLAWLALAISCVGLYGLVSYAVVRQRKALGVRLALGARAQDVVRHVMRGAAWPVLWGLLIGLCLAWALSRLLAHVTEHVLTFSINAFVFEPLLLVVVALLAAWLPARRSAAISPSECLRSDS